MSFKHEVNTAGDPKDAYTSNQLRFETLEEADAYGRDLASRWTAVRDGRSVESTDPVTHRIVNGTLESIAALTDAS